MRMVLKGLAVILVMAVGCEPMMMARIPQSMQDGVRYDAKALNWNEKKNYQVQVEFHGDKATIYFMDGESKVLALRNPKARKDRKNIEMVDESNNNYWDITISLRHGFFGR